MGGSIITRVAAATLRPGGLSDGAAAATLRTHRTTLPTIQQSRIPPIAIFGSRMSEPRKGKKRGPRSKEAEERRLARRQHVATEAALRDSLGLPSHYRKPPAFTCETLDSLESTANRSALLECKPELKSGGHTGDGQTVSHEEKHHWDRWPSPEDQTQGQDEPQHGERGSTNSASRGDAAGAWGSTSSAGRGDAAGAGGTDTGSTAGAASGNAGCPGASASGIFDGIATAAAAAATGSADAPGLSAPPSREPWDEDERNEPTSPCWEPFDEDRL